MLRRSVVRPPGVAPAQQSERAFDGLRGETSFFARRPLRREPLGAARAASGVTGAPIAQSAYRTSNNTASPGKRRNSACFMAAASYASVVVAYVPSMNALPLRRTSRCSSSK